MVGTVKFDLILVNLDVFEESTRFNFNNNNLNKENELKKRKRFFNSNSDLKEPETKKIKDDNNCPDSIDRGIFDQLNKLLMQSKNIKGKRAQKRNDFVGQDFISFIEEDMDMDEKENKRFFKSPWLSNNTRFYSGLMRLHFEILDFYNWIKPTKEEDKLKDQTIFELKSLLNSKFKNLKIKTFGSYTNDLHLSNSDIDIVIFSTNRYILSEIYNFLSISSKVDEIQLISAKVEIIKLVLKSTGVKVDIW